MARFQIEDVPAMETYPADPGRLSALMVKLILSSREFEVKVYDSNSRTGHYVVVLEGVLDICERERNVAGTDAPWTIGALAGAPGDGGGE